ncbi:MAG: hypothetical protein H0X45_06330 [Planctomycetes bacterium]|nr:hypothetical protein [Planctomycetota bacterium]
MPATMRPGFTLFEVAVAAAIMTIAVLSVILVLPVGLRAQQQARLQIYAGCKVLDIVDAFAQHDHTFSNHQIEAELNGQNTLMHQWPVDLDRMMMTPVLGLLPLPDALARRLDSDGDEIARVLDDGGRLFYASPAAYEVGYHPRAAARDNTAADSERLMPAEARCILFAVVGPAQQNALPNHPCLAWPYGGYYPAPPAMRDPNNPGNRWEMGWEYDVWNEGHLGVSGPALDAFRAAAWEYPSLKYSGRVDAPRNSYGTWQRYMAACLKLCDELGVAMTGADPYRVPALPADLADEVAVPKPWSTGQVDVHPPPAYVLAVRYLAFGAMARTNNKMWQTAPDLIPEDENYARDCEEACMRWARRYASTNPYDWGAARPLNRCSAFDFPLLQHDLETFVPTPVADGSGDRTWLVLAARPVTNAARAFGMYGTGLMPDNRVGIAASWSPNTSNFNLCAPFDAAERSRQIVCWSADWISFDDFEQAQTGPYDASVAFMDSRGAYVSAERAQFPPDWQLSWSDASRATRVAPPADDPNGPANADTAAYRAGFLGVHGADRNGNGRFDRGPLPSAARLRATSLGRYAFYDRRIICALRN